MLGPRLLRTCPPGLARSRHILISQHIVTLYSEIARAQTFENAPRAYIVPAITPAAKSSKSLCPSIFTVQRHDVLTFENVCLAHTLYQEPRLPHILISQHIATLYSEYARAQTFENACLAHTLYQPPRLPQPCTFS